jgi:hypothetical protein
MEVVGGPSGGLRGEEGRGRREGGGGGEWRGCWCSGSVVAVHVRPRHRLCVFLALVLLHCASHAAPSTKFNQRDTFRTQICRHDPICILRAHVVLINIIQ